MKKIICFTLTLFMLCASITSSMMLSSCSSDDSDSNSNSDNTNNQTEHGSVGIDTETYFAREIGGVQNSTDVYYCGEDIYLYVKVTANNTSSSPQSISMTITFENATYLYVTNESAGNVKPNIKTTDSLGDDKVITISDISFTVDPHDTKNSKYIFKVTPFKACEGDIEVRFFGSKIKTDEDVFYKTYKFSDRTNLDQIPAPIITADEDGFHWTKSPIANVDNSLYIVQVYKEVDNQHELVYSRDNSTTNVLKISDLESESDSFVPGKYRLSVITRGDGISLKDSVVANYSFEYLGKISAKFDERGRVTWDAVPGVSQYKAEFGQYGEYTVDTCLDLSLFSGLSGVVDVEILPISEKANALYGYSEAVSVKYLQQPKVTVSGAFASWSAVDGASSYDVYINGEYVETITDTRYRRVSGENIYLSIVARSGNSVISERSVPVDVSTD